MARALVVAAALVLVLAGCGGDPKADPSPTPSPPSTSPVGTTPSPPALPEEARANTKAGAIAFVRYYVALVNHAQRTGDVTPLQLVEGAGCESCRNVRQSIETIYGSGGSIEGGEWQPHVRVALRNDDGSWLVSGYLRFRPERVRRSTDSAVESSEGGSAFAELTVEQTSKSWKVIKWSRDS